MLGGHFTALRNVGVSLFFSETSKTHGRLSSTPVLLWQLHRHALKALFVVALQRGKEDTITVNNDKAKLFVVFEQRVKWFSLERVLATVSEHIDWPERLQINRDLLFSLSIFEKDNSAEDNQTVLRRVFVQFQL